MKTDIKLSKKVIFQKTVKKVIKKEKHAGGRPTSYDIKYCKKIITWMAKGYSITAFAGEIGVSKETIYEWIRVHKEFSDSVKIGRAKSVRFWEVVGIGGMMGRIKDFNGLVWKFNMQNRLGWTDKLTVDPENSYADEEADIVSKEETPIEKMQRLIEKYGKKLVPPSKLV